MSSVLITFLHKGFLREVFLANHLLRKLSEQNLYRLDDLLAATAESMH